MNVNEIIRSTIHEKILTSITRIVSSKLEKLPITDKLRDKIFDTIDDMNNTIDSLRTFNYL